MSFAPILLFVYNRLDHTQRTVEALLKNKEAEESILFVYSDFYSLKKDEDSVLEVRDFIKKIKGFKEVNIIERAENFGLAKSIIEGVSTVIKEYGKVIVLEDDLVTSKYFLSFMNKALDIYKNNSNVNSISGYTYPIEEREIDSHTFFLRIPMCWGWATWSDKWIDFEKSDKLIKESLSESNYINFGGSYDFFAQAKNNQKGKINTWFIFWYLTSVKYKRLTLFPKKSLVNNIGHDGTGVHCSPTDLFKHELDESFMNVDLIEVIEEKELINAHVKYFKTIKLNYLNRIINRIKKYI